MTRRPYCECDLDGCDNWPCKDLREYRLGYLGFPFWDSAGYSTGRDLAFCGRDLDVRNGVPCNAASSIYMVAFCDPVVGVRGAWDVPMDDAQRRYARRLRWSLVYR